MENGFKRFLSLALAIVMVLSNVPVQAFATDGIETVCTEHQYNITYNTATCTAPGVTYQECSVCHVTTEQVEAPIKAHDFGENAATCACGEPNPNYVAPVSEEPEHVHAWGERVEVTPASCEAAGAATQTCSAEGCDVVTQTVTIDALGHDYVDGICSRCQAEEPQPEVQPEADKGPMMTSTGPSTTADDVIDTVEELQAALDKGGVVVLGDDITSGEYLSIIQNEVTLDLNGKKLTSGNDQLLISSSNVTIKGNGEFGYMLWIGTYHNGQPSNVIIENGNYTKRVEGGETGTLTIFGGTFIQDVTDYCAEGYQAISNGDGTYTVRQASYAAEVNGQKYETLQAAIEHASVGATVKVLENVKLSETLVIAEGKKFTLDLNGKTISGTRSAKLTANDALIRITKGGELTITDSGENGTITYGYTGEATGWSGYSASTIENNQGTLVIEGGKIVSTTVVETQIAYAINSLTNSGIGAASVTIKGGEIKSEGSTAVRQFANCTEHANTLTIEGGKIIGRVQLQSSNANDNKGVLQITGGEIIREGNTAIEVWFSGGASSAYEATEVTIGGGVKVTGNLVFDEAPEDYDQKVITGGTFNTDVSDYVADGFVCEKNNDGSYGIDKAPATEVEVSTLAQLQAALADTSNNLPIVVITSIDIPAGQTVELNLNGKTVRANGQNVIRNNDGGKLTIKNGTIERVGDAAGYAVNNSNAASELILENVTIKGGVYTSGALTVTDANISQHYASRHAIYASNCEVLLNSGNYHNYNAGNATIFAYGSETSVTIKGGEFSIDNGKATHGWTSCLIDANAGAVYTIEDGTFKGHFRVQANSSMTIMGGIFENTHNEAYNIIGTATVKGGTFTDAAAKAFAGNNLASGFEVSENGTIVKGSAKVSDKATLKAAIEDAVDGDVIKLTADIDYGVDHLEIAKAITLDLGGKTLTTRARNYGIALKNGCSVTNGKLNHAGTVAAIKVWDAVEISNLEIDVTGTSSSRNAIGGIVLQANCAGVDTIKNVKIYSTDGQGVANGIETYNCGNAASPVIGSMENVTIDAVGNGMLLSAPCGTATNCTIKGGISGIDMQLKGDYSVSLNLVDCDVTGGKQAVYAHDEQKEGYTYAGGLTLTADEASTFVGTETGVELTQIIANVDDVAMDEDLTPAAARVGETPYNTVDEAFAAAAEGETITLLADATPALTSQKAITKASVIDLGGKTLNLNEDDLYFGTTTFKNGTIVVDPSVKASTAVFWMFKNQTLTFDNVKIVATGVTGNYLIGINGGTGTAIKLVDSSITIGNTAMTNLTAVICDNGNGNSVEIENTNIDVACIDGRFYLGGTNGTITVDDSKISLNGVKEGFYLRAGQALAIEGTSNVNIALNTNDGRYGINLTDLTATYTKAETATVVSTKYEPVAAAKIGDAKFATLQAAIDAVKDGETIVLNKDITETLVNIEKASGLAFTIDGQNHNFTGEFEVGIGENLTFKNINFTATAEISPEYFIDSMDRNSNVVLTVQNCTFTDTDNTTAAIGTHQPTSVLIENCVATGVHSLLQNQGGYNITVKNTTVSGARGMSLGSVIGATVDNVTINAADDKYGIRLNGENANNNITINNAKISAFIPVVVRKAQVENYSIEFTGTNTMTAKNTDRLWCVIGSTEYQTNGKMPDAATGKVKVILEDTGLSKTGVYGDYNVAKVGNVKYITLAEAITAAGEGGTVEILCDVAEAIDGFSNVTLITNVENGVTVTNTNTGSWIYIDNLIIGKGVTLKVNKPFYNAGQNTIEGVLKAGTFYNGYDAKTIIQNGGQLMTTGMIVNRYHMNTDSGIYVYGDGDNTTVEVSCDNTIGTYSGTFYVENAVVKGNMLWIDYKKGSDEEADKYSQSKPVFKNSTVEITKEFRLYKDATLTLEGSEVTADQVQVRENANPVVEMDANSTIKANTVLNLSGAMLNAVLGEDGTVSFSAVVAYIGNTPYYSLAAAIKAAKPGETVKVMAGTYAVPSMKAGITIEGVGEVLFEGTLKGTLENLTLKNLHIKGGNAQRYAYAKGNLVFENVIFEATSIYAIHFDGITAGATLTYKNCTIIGWAAMGGSPASCVFEGCTFKGNGTYGLIRTYFNATIENCTFDVANVNTNDNYQDGIHAVRGAEVTVNNCTNANGDMKDVVNISDNSIVVLDGETIQNVAKIGNVNYYSLTDAVAAAQAGDEIVLLNDVTIADGEVIDLNGVYLNGNGKKLTNNGELKFTGLNLTNVTIEGSGTTRFYNNINFFGSNSITTGINGTPFNLFVNEGATLLITRFTLGYNRNITVYGEIEDVRSFDPAGKTPSLKFNSSSGVSVGGTGTGNLTVENAYVELGNSSWKEAQGTYDWNFKNSYVSATSFTNQAPSAAESARWDVTFDNSVLAAKNYIKNGVGVTHNFTNGSVATTGSLRIDGVLNIDATSSVTTTSQQNNKVGAVDEHGGINGTVNVAGTLTIGSNSKTQLEVLGGKLNIEGGKVALGNNTLTLDKNSTLSIDVTGIPAGNYEGIVGAVTNDGTIKLEGNDELDAKIVDGKIVLTQKPVAAIIAADGAQAEYATLQYAINAAKTGETITILKDITATVMPTADSVANVNSAFVQVAKDKTVTIDLNGKTIAVTGHEEALYDTVGILNYGNLTIVDNAGNGKLTFAYHGTQEKGSSQIHSTILNFGTLIVNGGTIENKSTKGYGRYTINNYSWGGNANVTINGGYISNDTSVAVYADGYSDFGTYSCNVEVTDGTINGGLWYNGRTTTDGKNITISGGTFIAGTNGAFTIRNTPNTAVISGGTFNGEVSITEGLQPITGGSFSTDVSAYCAKGFALVQNNGMYEVAVDNSKLYVSYEYNSATPNYGVNFFSNYQSAYNYAIANNKTATIVIEKTNTLSGNCFDNNHKNYNKLAVVIKDGATMGVASSKWDMTYPVTVEPGASLVSARPKSASYINSHIKNTLTIGAAGSDKVATVDFIDGNSYQSGSIAVLYNGKIIANNAKIDVGDLGLTGSGTFNNCDITIDGVLAAGKNNWYKQTMTDCTVNVTGHDYMNENTYYSTTGTLLNNLTLTNTTITVDDGKDGTTEPVTIKNLNLNNSTVNADDAEKITVNGTVKVDDVKAVAAIGDTFYVSLQDALKAIKAGDTVVLLDNVTVTDKWDCRYNGAKITAANVTIDGNGKTLTVAGQVSDNNWNTVFRFEGDNATVKNLTIDASAATGIQRGITSKLNITVDQVTFIGNGSSAKYGVIFGEGAGTAIGGVTATVTNSKFQNWSKGLSDNANAQNAKTVTATGNTFTNAGVAISAAEAVTFTGNTISGAEVRITCYENDQIASVIVSGNTLAEGAKGWVSNAASYDDIQTEFSVLADFSVTHADGSVEYVNTLNEALKAAQAGEAINLLADVSASEFIAINKSLTINGNGHKITSSATRVFRITTGNVVVTLNAVNMVSSAKVVYPNDVRGISVDANLSGVQLTLNNCSVDFTDPSTNDWSYAVNVSGNGTGHTVNVIGGTYEGANVVNVNGAANTVTVQNATLNCLYANNDEYAGACIWVLQNQGSSVTATGNTFNGSNAVAFNLGTGTGLTESGNTDNTQEVIAKIGNEYYANLQEAVNAAAEQNGTVKLIRNITLTEALTIPAAKTRSAEGVTLDLNGKTLTLPALNNYAVVVKGTLNITDSSDPDSGKVIVSGAFGIGTSTTCTGGVNISGGNFIAQNDNPYIIGVYGGKATISGGNFATSYSVVNCFDGYNGAVEITGGNFVSTNEWAPYFTVLGNTKISGGTFNSEIIGQYLADGYVMEKNAEGTYGAVVGTYVAQIESSGYVLKYTTLDAAVAAAEAGEEIQIIAAGTYKVPTGKDLTITGAVAGVVFDNIGAHNMGGASMIFNNVTFTYADDSTYKGLQHAGALVYNDCIFNGQVFLYGESETFNNCIFNNTGNNYNVWTYGAKAVAFNGCTFNSDGKSVLVYNEGTTHFIDVTVQNSTFIASTPVDGKAAIEIDTSKTAGATITVDAATTVTGFGTGNVSGNSLWNNKMGNNTDANNDITVVVNGETKLAPVTFVAKIGEVGYTSIADAIKAANASETVTIAAGNYTQDVSVNKAITVVGETDSKGNNLVNITGRVSVNSGATVKNLNAHNEKTGNYDCALSINGKDIVIDGVKLTGYNGLRNCYAKGDVTIKNSTINGSNFAVHFDGSNGGNLLIENCDITGWVSYGGGIDKVTLKNSTFDAGSYAGQRSYADAVEIVGSTFKAGYKLDIAKTDSEITVTNSKMSDGSNIVGLFNSDDACGQNKIVIDGDPVSYVAKIGSVYYETLEEALAKVADWTTIKLVANASLDYGAREAYGRDTTTDIIIDGQDFTLTLNQTDRDWGSIGMKNAAGKLTLKNMTINKDANPGNGAWNNHAIIFSSNVEMKDVTVNNAIAVQNGATLNNVTINEAGEYYGLWINGNGQTVTVNGGAINATNGGRGIKIADQYIDAPASVTLSVTGTKFNTAKKAAVLVTSTAGAKITASNVDITNVAEDSVNFVWVDEGRAANYGEVTVTGASKTQEELGIFNAAIVDENGNVKGYYKTLQAAIDACVTENNIVKMLSDSADDVKVRQTEGVNLIIDGDGHDYSGTIYVDGMGRQAGADTLTIQNVNFTTDEASRYFIDANAAYHGQNYNYAHNVTVKDCTFTATGAGRNTAVGLRFRQAKNIQVIDCTAHGLHSVIQDNSSDGYLVENLAATNCKNGVSFTQADNVTVKDSYIKATGADSYGIRLTGYAGYTAKVEDCDVTAWIPVLVRDTTDDGFTLNVSGQNTMKASNTFTPGGEAAWAVFSSDDVDSKTAPVAPDKSYKLNVTDTGLDLLKVFPQTLKGSGTEADPYQISKLSDLILFRDSVNNGETKYNAGGVYVALTANIDMTGEDWSVNIGDDCNNTFDGIFDGKGYTISNLTGNETEAKSDGYVCTGLFGAIGGNAVVKNLTIDNAKINTGEIVGNNASAVVGFAYSCNGTIENVKVTNSTINAAKVTGTGAIVGYVHGGTLSVKNCSVENTNITGAAYVGGIVGYAYCKMGITDCAVKHSDITATSCCAGGIAGILENSGKIENATVSDVKLISAHENWKNAAAAAVGSTTGSVTVVGSFENITVNGEPSDAVVGSAHAKKPTAPVAKVEARIGNVYYLTLANAIANVADGETITLLTATELAQDWAIAGNITVDGEKFTIASGKVITLTAADATLTANAGLLKNVTTDVADYMVVYENDMYQVVHQNGADITSGLQTITTDRIGLSTTLKKVYARESLVVELWDGETKLSTTKYQKAFPLANKDELTASIVISGSSSSWTTTWHEALNAENLPDTIKVYVDGELADTYTRSDNAFLETKDLNNYLALDEVYKAAEINGTYYASLKNAINAAQNGETVTLLADNAENVTVEQKPDVVITIDGNGKTMTGKITVLGRNAWNGKETLTIKNINFKTDKDSHEFIDMDTRGTPTRYPVNVTIDSCTFTGNGTPTVVRGIVLRQARNVTVTNCNADNITSLLHNASGGEKLTVRGGTINAMYGINASNMTGDVVIEGVTINATVGYAIALNNVIKDQETVVSNCKIDSGYVDIRGDYVLTIDGTNTVHSGTWLKATNDGNIKVIMKDANLDMTKTEGLVANIDNIYYNSLQNAVNDAENGATVQVFKDHEIVCNVKTLVNVAGKVITIDLNGKKITANAVAGTNTRFIFQAEDGAELTMTDSVGGGTVVANGEGVLHYMFRNAGKMTIAGGNYELSAVNGGAMYFSMNNNMVVNGGMFTQKTEGWMFNAVENGVYKITVEGGTFNRYFIGRGDVVPPENPYGEVVLGEGKALVESEIAGYWTIAEAVAQNVQTGVTFQTVDAALSAAKSGETVIILKDTASAMVMVPAGITLDLNGKNYTVNVLVSFGDIVDGEAGGNGTLKATGRLVLDSDNNAGFLPIKDADGATRFFSYWMETRDAIKASAGKVKFKFVLKFHNFYAYDLLKDTDNSGVDLYGNISWDRKPAEKVVLCHLPESFVVSWCNNSLNFPNNNIIINVTVGGLDALNAGDKVYCSFTAEAPDSEYLFSGVSSEYTMDE